MQNQNPLIWPIYDLLTEQPTGWKIHSIAQALADKGLFSEISGSYEQKLFKKNFLVMNALYQLQSIMFAEHSLTIESINLSLETRKPTSEQTATPECFDPLREYYLDWCNLEVSDCEVKLLLDSFWQGYSAQCICTDAERDKALAILGLDKSASKKEIKARWKQLALEWHPDRSQGDAARFRDLNWSWQVLR